jgi:hypothetical protein
MPIGLFLTTGEFIPFLILSPLHPLDPDRLSHFSLPHNPDQKAICGASESFTGRRTTGARRVYNPLRPYEGETRFYSLPKSLIRGKFSFCGRFTRLLSLHESLRLPLVKRIIASECDKRSEQACVSCDAEFGGRTEREKQQTDEKRDQRETRYGKI